MVIEIILLLVLFYSLLFASIVTAVNLVSLWSLKADSVRTSLTVNASASDENNF